MPIEPGKDQWLYYQRSGFPDTALHLLPDGKVANRPGHAEATWALKEDGALIFRDGSGKVSAELLPRANCYQGELLGRYAAKLIGAPGEDVAGALPTIRSHHGTHPVVLHACGIPRNAALWKASVAFFNCQPREFGCPSNLAIITWSNRPQATLLEECLAHLGVEHRVLRPNGSAKWWNILKLPMTVAGLERIEAKYVLGMDALDVLLLASPETVLQRFLALTTGPAPRLSGCRLLFNAEVIAWPDHGHVRETERRLATMAGEMPFAHLNSGVFIGETEACRKWFAHACRLPQALTGHCDQEVLRSFYLHTKGDIRIDRRCDIFQTAWQSRPIHVRPDVTRP